jgi:hypothetical protein
MRFFAAAFLSFSAANFSRPAALSAASANFLALLNCDNSLLCLSIDGACIGAANKLGALTFFNFGPVRWTY